jgi:predicted signal transduction protein with EAL and GGDEF domain
VPETHLGRSPVRLTSRSLPPGIATKVLVADDDPVTRRILEETLKGAGYDVVVVDNGLKALECLSRKDGPRLALLDWVMPEMNGLTVCQEVRRHTERPYIYIVLLSGKDAKSDVVSGLGAGADDYLTKPWNAEELKARLRASERILKLEDKLVHESFHDPLTQLPNRALFLERLALSVSWTTQHPEYKFAVLSLDMDRFKVVNDSLGNSAGDRLLVDVANRLVASIRRDDTVVRFSGAERTANMSGNGGMVARLGGDKFSILLNQIQNASDGIRVAERIQQKMRSGFFIDGQGVFTTASIGIAFSGSGYSAAEDMLDDANTAMGRAKTLGRARYEMCDRSMHATAASRFRLESDLRRATECDEFRMHYQPIVALRDSRIVGFEALIRWERPEFGLTAPGVFIAAAEDTGLILPIGSWVLHEACRQTQAWNLEFPSKCAFTVAVNISALQFAQADLVRQIGQILRDTGLPPANLKLELTESITMRDERRTARILSQLRATGVRFSIDDFGTGYSSLSYLRRFAVDILKIDRSFVSEMSNGSESQEIVRTIVNLGANLRMDIVAEGVETAEQVSLLKKFGCEYAQGFLFSRPLDSDGITRMLSSSREHYYTLPQDTGPQPIRAPLSDEKSAASVSSSVRSASQMRR